MTDKTNFAQSLMHMIKGNLGTGILAMPASFAHCGLVNASLGLPLLCLIATYCVHLLVRSSQHLETKMKWINLEYAELAKGAFKAGPGWMKSGSDFMCYLVDAVLIISQMGICCVYLVFIIDSVESILSTYNIEVSQIYLFGAALPAVLLLSYIRTLKRLSIASTCANILQVLGISIIIEFLIREMPSDIGQRELFNPTAEVALGFGSAMFAFEGISVVLPIYTRMKQPKQMGGCGGIINISYVILLTLYFIIGFLGFLRFGSEAKGSITLNLPNEPFYDIVRAIFTLSLFLTYPLQFYVPNEIIWNWARSRLFITTDKLSPQKQNHHHHHHHQLQQQHHLKYEYLCRTILVLITFILAIIVPKLNLMMDLVGSISGTALSIIIPPIIHIAVFWEDTTGTSKAFMIIVDVFLIALGIIASISGSYFSFIGIVKSFNYL